MQSCLPSRFCQRKGPVGLYLCVSVGPAHLITPQELELNPGLARSPPTLSQRNGKGEVMCEVRDSSRF